MYSIEKKEKNIPFLKTFLTKGIVYATMSISDVSYIDISDIDMVRVTDRKFLENGKERRIQMEEKLTHFDEKGNAIMVDVTEKKITSRTATASGKIHVNEAVMKAVLEGTVAKGDVLGVARVAGIMAVKQTAHLIPMCHTLLITKCSVDFEVNEKELTIKALCTAKLEGKTGVEMEALTGVSVALLTIYDMCKAIDKRMEIGEIHLDAKSGGKSGEFVR